MDVEVVVVLFDSGVDVSCVEGPMVVVDVGAIVVVFKVVVVTGASVVGAIVVVFKVVVVTGASVVGAVVVFF